MSAGRKRDRASAAARDGGPTPGDASEERDPVTGLTPDELRDLADEAYELRDTDDAWEDEKPAQTSQQVRSVVSVRFNRGELGTIERAAKAVDMPISTFIRIVALQAASEGGDEDARAQIADLVRHMKTDLAMLARQLRLSA